MAPTGTEKAPPPERAGPVTWACSEGLEPRPSDHAVGPNQSTTTRRSPAGMGPNRNTTVGPHQVDKASRVPLQRRSSTASTNELRAGLPVSAAVGGARGDGGGRDAGARYSGGGAVPWLPARTRGTRAHRVADGLAGRSCGAGASGRADRPARMPRAGHPQVHACRDGGTVCGPVRAGDLWDERQSGGRPIPSKPGSQSATWRRKLPFAGSPLSARGRPPHTEIERVGVCVRVITRGALA
jgi:hypothetical protein